MKEVLKRIKADIVFSALVCVILGGVLIVWPQATIQIFCKVLAVGLIIMGAVDVITYLMNRLVSPFSGIIGLSILLIGIWVFFRPTSVVSLIPIVSGVILAIHGLQDLKLALEAKESAYEKWWVMLIIAAISILLGAICIVNSFGMVKLATQVIGVALMYDGISDFWIVNRTVHAAKKAKEDADAVDVSFKEMPEDENI